MGALRPVKNGLGRDRAHGVVQLLGARTPTAGPGRAVAGIVLCLTNHNSQLSIMKTLILLQGKTQIA